MECMGPIQQNLEKFSGIELDSFIPVIGFFLTVLISIMFLWNARYARFGIKSALLYAVVSTLIISTISAATKFEPLSIFIWENIFPLQFILVLLLAFTAIRDAFYSNFGRWFLFGALLLTVTNPWLFENYVVRNYFVWNDILTNSPKEKIDAANRILTTLWTIKFYVSFVGFFICLLTLKGSQKAAPVNSRQHSSSRSAPLSQEANNMRSFITNLFAKVVWIGFFAIVISFGFSGWAMGNQFRYEWGDLTPFLFFIGFSLIGFIVATLTFGLVFAILDIRDNTKKMADTL